MNGEFSGALRERVMIEKRLGNRDLMAGATGSYMFEGAAWAGISPLVPAGMTQAGDAALASDDAQTRGY